MKNKFLWLLAAVMLFDFGLTMLGQPSGYWRNPQMAHEGNPLFYWVMIRGWPFYFAAILTYIAAVLFLVAHLPRKTAAVTGLAFLLTHYCAGSGWLTFHFNAGIMGQILCAVVLAVALMAVLQSGDVKMCFGDRDARTP